MQIDASLNVNKNHLCSNNSTICFKCYKTLVASLLPFGMSKENCHVITGALDESPLKNVNTSTTYFRSTQYHQHHYHQQQQ